MSVARRHGGNKRADEGGRANTIVASIHARHGMFMYAAITEDLGVWPNVREPLAMTQSPPFTHEPLVSVGEAEQIPALEDIHQVIILIPTFRRPDLLKRLLTSLQAELRLDQASVIIGDNDCNAEIETLVRGFSDQLTISYLAVTQRGLAANRNALMNAGYNLYPNWRWAIMLDDDGWVLPGWFAAISAVLEAYPRHTVGGPVLGELPPNANILAQVSGFAGRARHPSGEVGQLNGLQNVAIPRSTADLIGLPLFDVQFNQSGGEDYDLFERIRHKGGGFAWCDGAAVMEPAPEDRLTPRAIIARYFTTGAYMTRVDLKYSHPLRVIGRSARGVCASVVKIGAGLVTGKSKSAATGLLSLCHHLGCLVGLTGFSSARYRATASPKQAENEA